MKKNNFSVNTHDEALDHLVSEYGLSSKEVTTFLDMGRTDRAINYARSLGYDIED